MWRLRNYEFFLPWLAVGALALTVGWSQRHAPRPAPGISPWKIPAVPYVPVRQESAETKTQGWNRPPSQTRGAEWVYDLFTPPEIYYDPRSEEFSVKPPIAPEPAADISPAVVVAPPQPFRLQLVGFVGGEGRYLGTFENLATTEHILARGGRALPELGVTIRDFQVKRIRREPADSMSTSELIATAVVRDERTGEDVVLTNLERAYARP